MKKKAERRYGECYVCNLPLLLTCRKISIPCSKVARSFLFATFKLLSVERRTIAKVSHPSATVEKSPLH
jgi:hypothetical protein